MSSDDKSRALLRLSYDTERKNQAQVELQQQMGTVPAVQRAKDLNVYNSGNYKIQTKMYIVNESFPNAIPSLLHPTANIGYRVMAQAVSHLPFYAQTQDRTHVSQCGICGGPRRTVTDLFAEYNSTVAPSHSLYLLANKQ